MRTIFMLKITLNMQQNTMRNTKPNTMVANNDRLKCFKMPVQIIVIETVIFLTDKIKSSPYIFLITVSSGARGSICLGFELIE